MYSITILLYIYLALWFNRVSLDFGSIIVIPVTFLHFNSVWTYDEFHHQFFIHHHDESVSESEEKKSINPKKVHRKWIQSGD